MNHSLNHYAFHPVANTSTISRKYGISARISKRVSSAMIFVTPETARDWFEDYAYEDQRPVRPQWVRYLAHEMAAGAFKHGTPLWFARLKSEYLLIDGHQRLLAVALSEVPILFSVILSRVEDRDEVGDLYAVIDHNRTRTHTDDHRAKRTGEKVGLNQIQILATDRAVRLIHTAFTSGVRIPVHVTVPWIKEWAPYAHTYFQAIAGGVAGRYMRKGPVVAAGLLTFCWQPEKAEEFWHQVSHDDGLRNGDPRQALHRWMMGNGRRRGRDEENRRLSPRQMALHLAQAWNAFLGGGSLRRISVKDPMTHLLLAGTPYNTDVSGYGLRAESYKLAA